MFLEANTSKSLLKSLSVSYWTLSGGRSPKLPESVHRLRPGDIDVIAAMGDSLTAGVGLFATNILDVLVENRGASAFIGGQGNWRTHLTLPNILKVRLFLTDSSRVWIFFFFFFFNLFHSRVFLYLGIQPEINRLRVWRFSNYSISFATGRRWNWRNVQRYAVYGKISSQENKKRFENRCRERLEGLYFDRM